MPTSKLRWTVDDEVSLVCVVAAAAAHDVGEVQVVDPVDRVAGEEAQREQFPAGLVHQLGRVTPSPREAAA